MGAETGLVMSPLRHNEQAQEVSNSVSLSFWRFCSFCLQSKLAKYPFWTMGPWLSKILINQNQLKKFMQVGIDVTYMNTNFGGCGLSSFGDIATFKNGQISLSTHGL